MRAGRLRDSAIAFCNDWPQARSLTALQRRLLRTYVNAAHNFQGLFSWQGLPAAVRGKLGWHTGQLQSPAGLTAEVPGRQSSAGQKFPHLRGTDTAPSRTAGPQFVSLSPITRPQLWLAQLTTLVDVIVLCSAWILHDQ